MPPPPKDRKLEPIPLRLRERFGDEQWMCGALTQGLGALWFTEFCLLPTLGCVGAEAAIPGFFVLPLLCSALAACPGGRERYSVAPGSPLM